MSAASNYVAEFWPRVMGEEITRASLVEALARSLGRIPRFGGVPSVPVDVATHSIAVAELMSPADPGEDIIHWLLHDAAEAFTGDVPTPVKKMLGSGWADLEAEIHSQILSILGVDPPSPLVVEAVGRADSLALDWECWMYLPYTARLRTVNSPPGEVPRAYGRCRDSRGIWAGLVSDELELRQNRVVQVAQKQFKEYPKAF